MTREQIEDALVAHLVAGLASPVISNPFGTDDDAVRRQLKHGLVVVTYAGGKGGANQEYGLLQEQTVRWSLICLARSYRSASERGDAALALLDHVHAVLDGWWMDPPGARWMFESERPAPLSTEWRGVMAYQITVSIPVTVER
ncbi:Gp37 family protein [Desulfohalovibrio reitneri]|uniref:Gp37 family protein n=1 Tax=Desulfohalovibrio reitneri TaxID=1307759 RepID=UPI0004A75CE8|nr:Gp37 family protein [Desulfohalovibrio reitneri]